MNDVTQWDAFAEILPADAVKPDERMSAHTSFRIGGPADLMLFPSDGAQLREILKVCRLKDISPYILGAGTNVLAPDAGIPSVVVCTKDRMNGITLQDSTSITALAGATLTRAASFAAASGLSGLEFAHGIPGTTGGGIYMNAGAYGGQIADVCEWADILLPGGDLRRFSCSELDFGYRHSAVEKLGGVVVQVCFRLTPSEPETVRASMRLLQEKRSASQPLDMPSAGSAFKRPASGYAAALIDQAGLKGYTVGSAAVSAKHAGFIVNTGGATAEDVKRLLTYVSDTVFRQSGIRLEPEIRIW